jgi:hypothetical protein
MKKIFTLTVLALAAMAATAQTKQNMFPAADTDADGWLWFDTAEKIEKYVGIIDETNYKVDPNGKPIQLVYADIFPDYPPSEASADIVGAGTDGETGSAGSRTGALMLQPSSASMSVNGGGFVVCMPSCSEYAICYSSNSRVMTRLVATTNVNSLMSDCNAGYDLNYEKGWKIINASYVSVFKRLPAGINNWSSLENLDNGSDETTLKNDKPIYVWFQSATPDTIYIHGIRAITQENASSTGIENINAAAAGKKAVYTIDGRTAGNNTATLKKGLYIVTEQGRTRKIAK